MKETYRNHMNRYDTKVLIMCGIYNLNHSKQLIGQVYYTLSKIDKDDKNKEIIDKIKEIFINNKE